MNEHEMECLFASITKDLKAVFSQPKYADVVDLAKDIAIVFLINEINRKKARNQRQKGHFDTTCVTGDTQETCDMEWKPGLITLEDLYDITPEKLGLHSQDLEKK